MWCNYIHTKYLVTHKNTEVLDLKFIIPTKFTSVWLFIGASWFRDFSYSSICFLITYDFYESLLAILRDITFFKNQSLKFFKKQKLSNWICQMVVFLDQWILPIYLSKQVPIEIFGEYSSLLPITASYLIAYSFYRSIYVT